MFRLIPFEEINIDTDIERSLGHRHLYKRHWENIDEIIELITNWLIEKKIQYVAGPVLSGAVLAFSIALRSRGKILPIYLNKDNYEPIKHFEGINFSGYSVAFIDDCVSDGNTFLVAERHAIKMGINKFEVIISKFNSVGVFDDYKGKLYTIVETK